MKRERNWKKWILAAAAVLLFGILLWSVRIKEIVITGSTRHTEENMVELLFPEPIDRNTLYCLYKEKFQPHK